MGFVLQRAGVMCYGFDIAGYAGYAGYAGHRVQMQGTGCRVYEKKKNVGRGGEGALKCRALLTHTLTLLGRL